MIYGGPQFIRLRACAVGMLILVSCTEQPGTLQSADKVINGEETATDKEAQSEITALRERIAELSKLIATGNTPANTKEALKALKKHAENLQADSETKALIQAQIEALENALGAPVDDSGATGGGTSSSFQFYVTGIPSLVTNNPSLALWILSADHYRSLIIPSNTNCPNSTSSTWPDAWTSSNTSLTHTVAAEGSYTICVSGKRGTTVSNYVYQYQFTYDATPPGTFAIQEPSFAGSSATVIWGASAGAATYRLSLGTNAMCSASQIGPFTTSNTSYVVSGLNQPSYFICISSSDTAGNQTSATNSGVFTVSGDASAPTVTGTPAASSLSIANVSPLNIAWTWTEATDVGTSGIAKYEVRIGTSTGSGDVLSPTNVALPLQSGITYAYTYSNAALPTGGLALAAGQIYYFAVRAVDAASNAGPWTEVAAPSSIDFSYTVGGAPTGLTNATNFNISVQNAAWYRFQLIGGTSTCHVYTDASWSGAWNSTGSNITSAIGADGSYTFCLSARSSNGVISQTIYQAQFTKDSTAPSAFSITGPASVTSTTATASWAASTGASSYNLTLSSTVGCSANVLGPYSVAGTSYTLTAPAEQIYYVCVTAVDAAGNSVAATNNGYTVNFDATPPTAPGTPSASTGSYSASTTVTFNWSNASDPGGSGVGSYNVQVGTSPGTANVLNLTIPIATTYTATGLSHGNTYYARVAAVDAAGNVGPWSANSSGVVVDTSVTTAASSLQIKNTHPGGSTLSLSNAASVYFAWTAGADNESGLDDYTVRTFRQASCAGAATTAATGVTTTYYQFTPDQVNDDGVTFSYQILTHDNAGNSLSSACSSSITFDFTAPPALSAFSGTAGTKFGDIDLSITYPGSTSDYNSTVIRRLAGTTPPHADCSSNGSIVRTITAPFVSGSIVDQNQVGGSAYSYRACIYDAAGNLRSSNTISNVTASLAASHIIFVTSSTLQPATGVSGQKRAASYFDGVCNSLATGVGINRTFKALIQAEDASARTRIAIHGPVYNMAGTKIADNRADLWDGTLAAAPGYDETGAVRSTTVYTGSNSDGTGTQSCTDWSLSNYGQWGTSNVTNGTWLSTANANDSCTPFRSLYCVSTWPVLEEPSFSASIPTVGSNGDVALTLVMPADVSYFSQLVIRRTSGLTTPDPDCTDGTAIHTIAAFTANQTVNVTDSTGSAGGLYSYRVCLTTTDGNLYSNRSISGAVAKGHYHKVFLTSAAYSGNLGGLSGADAECVTRATAAGQSAGTSGTWKAILSTSTASAYYRLSLLGPVYNVNGQVITTSAASFWSNASITDQKYTETGAATGSTLSWTGSAAGGVLGSSACSNWTSSSAAVTGAGGDYGYTNSNANFWASGSFACNTTRQLMCITQSNTPEISAFSAVKGVAGATGSIDLSLTLPSDISNYAQIDLRRWASGLASEDCSTGTIAASWTTGFVNNDLITYTDNPGLGTYSYRVCVTDIFGYKLTGKFVNRVDAKGSISHTYFQTSQTFAGNLGGLAGADSSCQTAANNAGLSGTYKAVISSNTESARYRVTILGAMFTTSNVMLFSSPANFWSNIWAAGGYTYRRISENSAASTPNEKFWAGGFLKGSATNCSNWTSNSAGVTGGAGSTDISSNPAGYFATSTPTCNNSNSLLCVSQSTTENLTAFTAATGAGVTDDTDFSITFPADTSRYSLVQVRRLAGLSAPSENCELSGDGVTPTDGSTVVRTYDTGTGFTSGSFTVNAEGFYSYRACVYDSDGFILSRAAEKVSSKGSLLVVKTAITMTGNLGGLSGADTICTNRMIAQGFSGTYKATLSSSTVDLSSRLTVDGPVYTASGVKLFTNKANMLTGTSVPGRDSYNILNDAGGADGGNCHVVTWESSISGGTKSSASAANFCQDWTSSLSTEVGYRYWGACSGGHYWFPGGLYATQSSCNNTFALNCISQ